MDLVIYLVAFIVCIVMIIAQCQLFAIRGLLETLVKQNGRAPMQLPLISESNVPDPPPTGSDARAPNEGWTSALVVAGVIVLAAIVALIVMNAPGH
jgi:hypothetical protein